MLIYHLRDKQQARWYLQVTDVVSPHQHDNRDHLQEIWFVIFVTGNYLPKKNKYLNLIVTIFSSWEVISTTKVYAGHINTLARHRPRIQGIFYFILSCIHMFWDRVAQLVLGLTTHWTIEWLGFNPQQRQRVFHTAPVSRPSLRLIQPPIQWVPGVLSLGLKARPDMMLTTHPNIVLRSRKNRAIPHISLSLAWQ
jgi:hypothetical protein